MYFAAAKALLRKGEPQLTSVRELRKWHFAHNRAKANSSRRRGEYSERCSSSFANQVTSYELQVTSYQLPVTSYQLLWQAHITSTTRERINTSPNTFSRDLLAGGRKCGSATGRIFCRANEETEKMLAGAGARYAVLFNYRRVRANSCCDSRLSHSTRYLRKTIRH